MENTCDDKSQVSIVDLFPDLTAQEQAAAEYNFKQYIDLVLRIYERCSHETPGLLTEQLKLANVKKPRNQAR